MLALSLIDSVITLLNDSNVCLLSQSSLEIGTHSGCFLHLLQLFILRPSCITHGNSSHSPGCLVTQSCLTLLQPHEL